MIASRGFPETAPTDRKEAPTPAPRTSIRALLAIALAAGLLAASPALADTKSQLDAAKADLAGAQQAADRAVAEWNAAETRLGETEAEIANTRVQIGQLQAHVSRIQTRLEKRAVLAFENGPASTIDVLLSSGSFSEFSDRLEFLGNMQQSDSDLVVEQRVATEQLQRTRADLAVLAERQTQATAQAQAAAQKASSLVAQVQSKVNDLTAKYRQELALAHQADLLGQRTIPGAAIATCPVRGPNSFVDSFGWPRPGGRIHEGIDMISPFGTPVVAVQPGRAEAHPNTLGGNAVIVFGPGGDFTYYAHLSSYGPMGSVAVGTVIGYVGSTGDTNVNHLHFEYHPGGGAAVDPYNALRAVC